MGAKRVGQFYKGVAHVLHQDGRPEVCAMFNVHNGERVTLLNSSIRTTMYDPTRSGVIVRGVEEMKGRVRDSDSRTERRKERLILSHVLRAIRDGASEMTPVQPELATPLLPGGQEIEGMGYWVSWPTKTNDPRP